MEILIDGKKRKYQISADERQFVLSELKTKGEDSKTPGEKYFDDLGYYPTIQGVCEKLIRMELIDSDVKTLGGIIKESKSIRAWLEVLFDGSK